MAITYATFPDFTAVYSIKGISETEINSRWLPEGALRVNESLGGYFATPFSSNNHTARDLSIQYAFLGISDRNNVNTPERTRIGIQLDQRISDVRCGNTPMILDDGTSFFSDNIKVDAWSNTQEFHNTFNMLDPLDQRIDRDQIQDELDEIR